MKLKLIKIRDSLADSFWFLPLCMAFFAACLALGMVSIDHGTGAQWAQSARWVWSGGPDGARSVLSTVAGSVMTVVSIVFSLTISVLAQTSSHFGPRVLRNFTSDRGVQFTLGTFISTFVYSLLVLRTVRSIEEAAFVPYLSVNLGILLAIASLAVLIFFIHHVSQTIQAENLVADVGRDFQRALDVLLPEDAGEDKEVVALPDDHWKHRREVASIDNGYLQRVDDQQLMRLATRHDLQLELRKRPGEFVSRRTPLLWVVPPSHFSEDIERQLRACFVLGVYRTPHQDILFSMQQLVEIAAHALSSGINEPSTALTCLHWLDASLRAFVHRKIPSPFRQDGDGNLRLVAYAVSFKELVQAPFEQIRIYGATTPDMLIGLLRIITQLAPDVRHASDREVLAHHARLIGEDASQISNSDDRERVARHLRETLAALNDASATSHNSAEG